MVVQLTQKDNAAIAKQIELAVDTVGYTSKPTGAEIGKIRNRLSGAGSHQIADIKSLANWTAKGLTVQGALLRDKYSGNEDTDSRFIKQQVFVVDIDNTGEKRLTTTEEIQSICEAAGIAPAVIAESFSSSDKLRKYHAFFVTDKPIEDVQQARSILLKLQGVFDGIADPACKDPARIIFGTAPDKNVYITGGCTPIEALEALTQQQEAPEQATAPAAKPAPQRVAKSSHSEYLQADPDVLLTMIDTNILSYDEFCKVTASHKAAGGSDDVWEAWADNYVSDKHSRSEVMRQNRKTRAGMKGKSHTIGTLKYFAEKYNSAGYSSYIAALSPDPEELKQKNRKAKQEQQSTGTRATAPAEPKQAEQVEAWQPIKPIEKAADLQPFDLKWLPKVLREYAEAVANYNAVYKEMCVLPLFTALSIALQGKAIVHNPGNGHPETLNLYCITIAPPGERKTNTLKLFLKPIYDYEQRYNDIHRAEIEEYSVKHKMLSHRLNNTIQRAKKPEDEQEALRLRKELSELEADPKTALNYTIQDVTPEALIQSLYENKEKSAIVGDEGTLFKILGGAYSGGKSSNVNFDILLNCYDGTGYKVSRKGSGNIYLKSPVLTIGVMIQPAPFKQILSNTAFSGNGFIHRFLFALPKSNAGNVPFRTPQIPDSVKSAYSELITRLLSADISGAELTSDREATRLFEDYHCLMESKKKSGGMFADNLEFASKQVAKVLKIAALLHLCEHSHTEPINGTTALNAINIGLWAENQSAAVLEADMVSDLEKNSMYVFRKLKSCNPENVLTRRDIQRMCRRLNSEELQDALSYLDDMNVLRYQEDKQTRGRPTMKVTLNPEIKNFNF